MSRFDRSRRAVTVLLVAACFVLVPQLATAGFTSVQQTAALTASTATMAMPANVTGSWSCWVSGGSGHGHGYNHGHDHDDGWEAVQVTVKGFTDAGPAGATYRYSLGNGTVPWVWAYSTTDRTGWLLNGSEDDKKDTTWTLTIQSSLGSWTGPTFTKQITCPKNTDSSGTF
jgi:hypothetical protein